MDEILNIIGKIKIKKTIPVVERLQWLLSVLSAAYNPEQYYTKSVELHDGQMFDFIVVGGGTAGCVLANRLTETNATVLLAEYGDVPGLISDIPGFFPIADSINTSWGFRSVNDGFTSQEHKTQNVRIPQGRMLGGTSGLNYMLYVRGLKKDYEDWFKRGNEGWDWDSVLHYFRKSENFRSIDNFKSNSSCLHGTEGNLGVTQLRWERTKKVLNTLKEHGYSIMYDINNYNHRLGFGEPQFTIADDTRQSTAAAYMTPVRNRPNLSIALKSLVTKIIINDKAAVGVEIKQSNKNPLIVKARKEVIVSCGVINTPKLLMLSGIGSIDQLNKHDIKIIHESPHVGKHLHDNPLVPIGITGNQNILSKFQNTDLITNIKSIPVPFIIGRQSLDEEKKDPDYQINMFLLPPDSPYSSLFCDYIMDLNADICAVQTTAGLTNEVLYSANILLNPKSRGKVELQNKDPHAPPAIFLGYYKENEDLERHVKCIQDYIKLINTTYSRKNGVEVVNLKLKNCDAHTFLSTEYWKCYALNLVGSMWDLTGTCRMGPEGEGVVDTRLRVTGLKNLRIVDASVIPNSMSGGSISATVVMIAEKAADMIKADHGYIKNIKT